MSDQVEEIKDKIDIVRFISEFVPLKKAGRNWKALCPFHSEKTPSFMVNPERGIFRCFGCGIGGDAFTFLQKMEGIGFPEALRILAKRTGVKLTRFVPDEKDQLRERFYALNSLAAKYYAYILQNHPVGVRARKYLRERRITPKAVEIFKLGYAPRSWDNLLRFIMKKGFSREEGERAGLLIKSEKGTGYYDRFRGRIIFPLTDHRGNVRGFAGRVLDPEAKEAKYVNTPETPIYQKRNLLYGLDVAKETVRRCRQAIVVEGETDMIASFMAGVKNVVAIKGSALTEEQTRLLKRYADELLLALDADFAGDEAARRGIELADRAGFGIRVIQIPLGKDPDECVRQDPKAWKKAVESAVPIYDFAIETAVARHGTKTARAKQQVSQDVLPVLAKITDPIVQSHYRQKLSELLGVDEEDLIAAMKKQVSRRTSQQPGAQKNELVRERKTRQERLEEHFLSLLLQGMETRDELPKRVTPLITPVLGRLWQELGKYLKKHKHFSPSKFVQKLPPELVETADRLSLVPLEGLIDDRGRWKAELEVVLHELKQLAIKREFKRISAELAKAQGEAKRKKLAVYTKRLARLSKSLDR